MAFKYLSKEWEHVRDIIFESGTQLALGNCNWLAAQIVERWKGPDTDIFRIVVTNYSLRDVPEYVQDKIREYLTTAST